MSGGRRGVRLAGLLAGLLLSGGVAADVTRFAYAVNAFDSTVSLFHVNAETGALRAMGHVPVKKFPGSAVVHPNGRFLYVSTQTGMVIHAFAIDAVTGRLTEIAGSPFASGVVSPFWLAIDPKGEFLYTAGRNSNAVGAYRLDAASGALSPLAGSPYPGGFLPRSVAVRPGGDFVYLTGINDDTVTPYRVDRPEQRLQPLPKGVASAGDAPQYMTFDAPGNHLYVTSWNSKSLVAFGVQADGTLHQATEYGLGDGISPFGVTTTPDGRFLYVASWFSGIAGFRIDASDGRLQSLPGSPFPTFGVQPVQIIVEPASQYAYVTNYGSNTISEYRIDGASGNLQPLETLVAQGGPRAMAFVRGSQPVEYQPRFAFTLDAKTDRLRTYAIAADGTLKRLGETVTGREPVSLALDPLLRYLLVANRGADNVSVYRIDNQGGLQEVSGSPFKAGKKPMAVRIDYNGLFAYVLNEEGGSMSAYLLYRDTGQMEEAPETNLWPASPYPVGQRPSDLQLHATDRFAYVLNRGARQINFFKRYGYGPLVISSKDYGSPVALTADIVAMVGEYSGRFLYALDSAGKLAAYTLDLHNGTPVALADKAIDAGSGAQALATHPQLPILYVLNSKARTISRYRIDGGSGRLQVAGKDALTQAPLAMQFDPAGKTALVRQEGKDSLAVYRVDGKTGALRLAAKIPAGTVTDMALFAETR